MTISVVGLCVTLKVATSLDGKIATHAGHSQWITGPDARTEVHKLRSEHDAVLTGIGTVLADDPHLNVRGLGDAISQPLRFVLDSQLRTPLNSKIIASSGGATRIFTLKQAVQSSRSQAYRDAGVELIEAELASAPEAGLSIPNLLHQLRELGVERLMVEAGAKVASSFLRARAVDRLEWFRAPKIIGGDGLPVFTGVGVGDLAEAFQFARTSVRSVGDDLWETYERQKAE